MAETRTLGRRNEPREAERPSPILGALVGILVLAVALATSQLVAALIAPQSSPVASVAQRMIDDSPESVKSFAIARFGTHDKLALTIGIIVILFGLAAALGVVMLRRPWVGNVAVAVLGLVGCAAALTQPEATPSWAIPTIAGASIGWLTLRWLLPRAAPPATQDTESTTSQEGEDADDGSLERRTFIRRGATVAVVALGAAAAAPRLARGRLVGAISRAHVHIPQPRRTVVPPTETPLDVPGLTPLITPNDRFYRVDTAFIAPQISADSWRLRIHGMVDREMELGFHELLKRPLIERDVTLTCVSNRVGGHLAGNAQWVGIPLLPLLQEAGVRSGATQIVGRSPDGMTIGTPTAVALDGRDSMLAVQMNGQPLPVEHGFPVRMIVPGLYGYESATKWLVDLELTTDEVTPYWVGRGWARQVAIRTECRIDTPESEAHVAAGAVAIAGVAWAQHRGIAGVEVRVDDGPWNDAVLGPDGGIDSWRQWVWRWPATPGTHTIQARATDRAGAVQTPSVRSPFPSGATGWPRVEVTVG